jgi:hypothetical protein
MPPASGTYAELNSVSCASSGNCAAVGTNDGGGVLFTERSGKWASGVEAALPANADSGLWVSLKSVSCGSAGNCTAVGSYRDSSWEQKGLLLSERSGVWASGAEAALPVNADSDPSVSLESVSCASAGHCTAVGTYVDSSGNRQGLLLSENSGVWSTGVEATLPTDAATGLFGVNAEFCNSDSPCVTISSVSCASTSNCSAVGSYNDSSGHREALVLSQKSGTWVRGVQVTLPANSPSGDHYADLASVSCASVGYCSAVGLYVDRSHSNEGLLLKERSGKWVRGVEATLPRNADSNPSVSLASVSCGTAGNCAAVGSYAGSLTSTNGSTSTNVLLLSESAGRWARGVEATLPANAGSNPLVGLSSVSCASAGNCAAVGSYTDGSNEAEGLLVTESSRRWARGVEAALPANAATFPTPGLGYRTVAGLGSVSCTYMGRCSAAGEYTDDSDIQHGLLLSGTLSPDNTKITHARIDRTGHTASFTFIASGATKFQCALAPSRSKGRDYNKPTLVFRPCVSPRIYDQLKHGRYTFEVRGLNRAGAVDPKPASRKFRI